MVGIDPERCELRTLELLIEYIYGGKPVRPVDILPHDKESLTMALVSSSHSRFSLVNRQKLAFIKYDRNREISSACFRFGGAIENHGNGS